MEGLAGIAAQLVKEAFYMAAVCEPMREHLKVEGLVVRVV